MGHQRDLKWPKQSWKRTNHLQFPSCLCCLSLQHFALGSRTLFNLSWFGHTLCWDPGSNPVTRKCFLTTAPPRLGSPSCYYFPAHRFNHHGSCDALLKYSVYCLPLSCKFPWEELGLCSSGAPVLSTASIKQSVRQRLVTQLSVITQ